jgi:hypothetical protein
MKSASFFVPPATFSLPTHHPRPGISALNTSIRMRLLNSIILGLAAAASSATGAVVERRSLASDILADIESAADCAGCDVRIFRW